MREPYTPYRSVKEPKHAAFTIGCLLLATGMVLLAGRMDAADEALADAHYCRMTALFESSGGENGWPDYRGDEVACDE